MILTLTKCGDALDVIRTSQNTLNVRHACEGVVTCYCIRYYELAPLVSELRLSVPLHNSATVFLEDVAEEHSSEYFKELSGRMSTLGLVSSSVHVVCRSADVGVCQRGPRVGVGARQESVVASRNKCWCSAHPPRLD